MATPIILFELLLALSISVALATDPGPLQDFCVADAKSRGMTILCAMVEFPYSSPWPEIKINNIFICPL